MSLAKKKYVPNLPYSITDATEDRSIAPEGVACSVTSASVEVTCSDHCTFKRTPMASQGCLADCADKRALVDDLDAAASQMQPLQVIRHEAKAIATMAFYGIPQDGYNDKGRDLLIHDVGDCGTDYEASLIGNAAYDWREGGGGSVWTNTHSWDNILRASWGDAVSVLASIEHPSEAEAVMEQGYAPILTMSKLPEMPSKMTGSNVEFIPCPADLEEATCVECRLCLDYDLFGKKKGIVRKLRGDDLETSKKSLRIVQGNPALLPRRTVGMKYKYVANTARKCSLCGKTGHDRRKCPNVDSAKRQERREFDPWHDLEWNAHVEAMLVVEDNPNGMTLEQIGEALEITRERVRQIEATALEKLQVHEIMRGLEDPDNTLSLRQMCHKMGLSEGMTDFIQEMVDAGQTADDYVNARVITFEGFDFALMDCERCGDPYVRLSGRQRYCESCKSKVRTRRRFSGD